MGVPERRGRESARGWVDGSVTRVDGRSNEKYMVGPMRRRSALGNEVVVSAKIETSSIQHVCNDSDPHNQATLDASHTLKQ